MSVIQAKYWYIFGWVCSRVQCVIVAQVEDSKALMIAVYVIHSIYDIINN